MSGQAEAEAAARRVAGGAGLDLGHEAVLLPGVANTVLHFPTSAVVAKVAVRERFRDAVRKEHAIGTELAELGAAAPRPLAGVPPAVDDSTGFIVTLWHHIVHDPTVPPADEDCLTALNTLHNALDRTTTPLPAFTAELQSARAALDNDAFVADLARSDRALLVDAFDAGFDALEVSELSVYRLHGEPHAANRLVTPAGVVWVDLESCCTGPREWDLAFLPPAALAGRQGVDHGLLLLMRVLNAARLATWQCGLMRAHPHLGDLAAEHLAFVRDAMARHE